MGFIKYLLEITMQFIGLMTFLAIVIFGFIMLLEAFWGNKQ